MLRDIPEDELSNDRSSKSDRGNVLRCAVVRVFTTINCRQDSVGGSDDALEISVGEEASATGDCWPRAFQS